MTYVDLLPPWDPSELLERAHERMRQFYPGWEPTPTSFTTRLFEAIAYGVAGPTAEFAGEVPDEVFRAFIEQVMRIPMLDGVAAQLSVEVTFKDTAGYVLPEGTRFSVKDASGEPQEFQTAQPWTVASGSDVLVVNVHQVEPNSAMNGLIPAPGDVELAESVPFVLGVEGDGPITGGSDPETVREYMDRASDRIRLMSRRPVLAPDFAVLARDIPGVVRATAINNFIPPSDFTAEKAVAVVVHGPDGVPVASLTKTQVAAYLEEMREQNFIVSVIDPTYTTVNVAAAVQALPGYSTASVETAVEDVIAVFLDPGRWGSNLDADGDAGWSNVTKVRYFDVIAAIDGAAGVDYISGVTLNATTADVTLSGVAPLPQAGTITVTVTA